MWYVESAPCTTTHFQTLHVLDYMQRQSCFNAVVEWLEMCSLYQTLSTNHIPVSYVPKKDPVVIMGRLGVLQWELVNDFYSTYCSCTCSRTWRYHSSDFVSANKAPYRLIGPDQRAISVPVNKQTMVNEHWLVAPPACPLYVGSPTLYQSWIVGWSESVYGPVAECAASVSTVVGINHRHYQWLDHMENMQEDVTKVSSLIDWPDKGENDEWRRL